jgi:hypothetical protein
MDDAAARREHAQRIAFENIEQARSSVDKDHRRVRKYFQQAIAYGWASKLY